MSRSKYYFLIALLFLLRPIFLLAAQPLEMLPPKSQHAKQLEAVMANPQDELGQVILSLPNKNFMSPDIQWYEAHWQGMDTMELDKELKLKLGYPLGLEGIFVIEVTMNAAHSGMLAGDIVVAVEATEVKDLKSFQLATRNIRNKSHAAVTIMRKIKSTTRLVDRNTGETKADKVVMEKRVFSVRDKHELGFAQVESAPMIVPGEFRPHPYRGACTLCHAIGHGFQLAQDPDLITLPPPIISNKKADGVPPHEYKGQCHICHQINQLKQNLNK